IRFSRSVAVAVFVVSSAISIRAGHADPSRLLFEVQPITVRASPDTLPSQSGSTENSFMVLGFGLGFPMGRWMPYIGGAAGFMTVQARLGASLRWSPNASGFIGHVEVRPQVASIICGEPALLGNIGAGYRWLLASGKGISLEPSMEM